ncbi:hypothetical protein P7C71_g1689, partial [Lecanoromycetidae sp. Uapishka_2]
MSGQDLPICTACASQFDTTQNGDFPSRCKICDDPRQFVPPSGQSWTSLAKLKPHYQNKWQQDFHDPRIWTIWTEPKFGVGQRCFLLRTPGGNVLWDCIALLDANTVDFVKEKGGLVSIVISHPHYYTSYVEWAEVFKCPVFMADDDREWVCRQPPSKDILRFIEGPVGTRKEIVDGVTAIKLGGHFPGSLVLHWEKKLFIADTIVTVPSAYTPHPRPPGQTSYAFMWAIPNMIPLPPNVILDMWLAIRNLSFDTTHGAFVGMDVRDEDVKKRVLESMKIQVGTGGWKAHEILDESDSKDEKAVSDVEPDR